MRVPRRTRFRKAAVVVGLGLATLISSTPPASAATLAVTSLSCSARHGGLICEAYVSGGAGGYTYTWNQGRFPTSYPDHSRVLVDCLVSSTTVAIFVSDSSGATASKSQIVDCYTGTA
jgi:hypothetical protein